MKKKCIQLFALLLLCTQLSQAQTLTVINQTDCDLMIFSSTIKVVGVAYNFGSETPGLSMSFGNTTVVFTTFPNAPSFPPNPLVPLYTQKLYAGPSPAFIPYMPNSTANQYIGFKFRLINGSAGGYISAANPVAISGSPIGCNNGLPYTVTWSGPADNPVVKILP